MAPFVAKRIKKKKQALLTRIAIASVGFVGALAYVQFGGAWSTPPTFLEDKLEHDGGISGETRSFSETLVTSAFNLLPSDRRRLDALDDDDKDDEERWGKAEVCAGVDFPLFTGDCKVVGPKQRGWVLPLAFLGLLYLFVGIAIVCDELFVPALEIIAERNELSNDVAGATLMAAGGSAPELATSLIGAFKRSDVGFGTIVGSAVFNVLFVIGCCVLWTPVELRPLQLTWWPLFRDCLYYILTLCTLCIFMYTGDGRVELWEAVAQFSLYLGYVTIMMYSEQLEAWVKTTAVGKMIEGSVLQDPSGGDQQLKGLELGERDALKGEQSDDPNRDFAKETKFRAGILNLLTDQASMADAAGVIAVAKVKGSANEVFKTLDLNGDGVLDGAELRPLCKALGHYTEVELSDKNMAVLVQEIDPSPHPQISKGMFAKWYVKSEERIRNNTKSVFDKIARQSPDASKVKSSDLKHLLASLGNEPTDTELKEAEVALGADSATGIVYDVFHSWYENSLFWTEQLKEAEALGQQMEEEQESLWDGLLGGFAGLGSKSAAEAFSFLFTVPLVLACCLIPDCRPPHMDHKCYRTFFGSICGIAVLSFLMVDLGEIVGATLGIPDVIMGLTILAAGTSVPDLLSSVIVARQGQGDMAVSSSIGSNIFDVCVGLPIPWLIFNIALQASDCKQPVLVAAGESMFISLVNTTFLPFL